VPDSWCATRGGQPAGYGHRAVVGERGLERRRDCRGGSALLLSAAGATHAMEVPRLSAQGSGRVGLGGDATPKTSRAPRPLGRQGRPTRSSLWSDSGGVFSGCSAPTRSFVGGQFRRLDTLIEGERGTSSLDARETLTSGGADAPAAHLSRRSPPRRRRLGGRLRTRQGQRALRTVLSIGKLAPAAGEYYLEAVAQGVEDYYLGAGEAPACGSAWAPANSASRGR
jgi:hypothetical protein